MVATQQTLKEETVSWHGIELDLLQRMATVAAKAFPFSVEERDRRLATLAAHARTLDRDIERALGFESVARSHLETAQSALEAARKASSPEIASIKTAERIFDTHKAMADMAAATLNMLQAFRQTVPLQQQVLRERYDLQHDNDPGRMRAAIRDSRWRGGMRALFQALDQRVIAGEASDAVT